MLRVITLNLNGIRSAATKGFYEWLATQDADIVCLQEVKAQEADLTAAMLNPPGWHGYFHCAEKKGYSGVAIYARRKPAAVASGIGVAEFDVEGRYIQADFDLPGGPLSVVSLYLPSGSSSEERQQAKFRFMAEFAPRMDFLRASGREVIVCGDWNIAHREADLKNWKSNQKNSGFLPEERAWLGGQLDAGWVDVYRRLEPDATDACYTWWSNRGQAWAKNVGWRLDYQLATPLIAAQARQAAVYKAQRFSDHAPLSIDYLFPVA
ncbi:exodeoxyribonuclease III [Uliginosibacterium sp. 31-16]|uniref:exodeoxyribonuclease III n=1 Tax=Uliginosibacterium sp. 31-16 TaxID=3068315 RepID=UPI00273FC5C2|nr:exodeoxyribonuclease III [Uliginosibacterium sp. 31-16]MDP5239221.1 exodeoxyribonuclease III [Uliginosibacterium sp. 31-16]